MVTSKYLPVSKQSRAISSDIVLYDVTFQYENYANLDVVGLPRLAPGTLMEFNTGAKGVVIKSGPPEARVLLASTRTVERAYKAKSPLVQEPKAVKLYLPNDHIGQLSVLCKGTGTPKAGLVGWSLFSGSTLIAEGCDLLNKDHCVIEGLGLWLPGTYRLRVTSFLDTMQPLKRGVRQWIVSQPSKRLTAGEYTDKLGPILLT
jgi:hypothetical protein